MQWNVGMTRRLSQALVAEVSYVGARGDNLIRPTDINYPQPVDVVALQDQVPGAVNQVRPYRSFTRIRMRETTARSRYHGLLTSVRLDKGREGGLLTVNYTLSRNQTDSTNDRDDIDIPQNPLDPEADYADARTDRRHIFNASYVYELPFFRTGPGLRAGRPRRLAGGRHRQHQLRPAGAAHERAHQQLPARRLCRSGR